MLSCWLLAVEGLLWWMISCGWLAENWCWWSGCLLYIWVVEGGKVGTYADACWKWPAGRAVHLAIRGGQAAVYTGGVCTAANPGKPARKCWGDAVHHAPLPPLCVPLHLKQKHGRFSSIQYMKYFRLLVLIDILMSAFFFFFIFSSRFSFCLTFYFLARFPLIFLHRLIFLLVLIFPLLIFLHIHFSPNLPLLNYTYFYFLKIASSIFQGLFPLILLHVYIFPLNFLHVLIFSFEIRHFRTFFSSYFSSDLPQCFYFFNVIYLLVLIFSSDFLRFHISYSCYVLFPLLFPACSYFFPLYSCMFFLMSASYFPEFYFILGSRWRNSGQLFQWTLIRCGRPALYFAYVMYWTLSSRIFTDKLFIYANVSIIQAS